VKKVGIKLTFEIDMLAIIPLTSQQKNIPNEIFY